MRRTLLVLFSVAAVAAPAAQAAYPGANGKLVFFQNEVGGVDPVGLAVSDADGRNQSVQPLGPACGGEGLTGPSGPCPGDPIWSPDGTRIAFALGGTVATMKPDGTDVRRLPLTGFSQVTSPAWSPDGARIAFSARRGRLRNVYMTSATGGPVVALTKSGGGSPAWSVRGEIAFTRGGQVLRMPAAGGKARRLTTRGGSSPTWSPGGSALAFVRSVRLNRKSKRRTPVLYRLRRDGRGLKRLTRSYAADPSWTPDGTGVLYHDFDSFNLTIRSVRAGGGGNRLVTSGDEGRRVAAAEPDQQPLPR